MNLFLWFIVGSITVFVVGLLTIGGLILYKLRKKNTVQATIFLKAGGLKLFWFDRRKNVEREVNGKAYRLDERAVHKNAWRDYIYFLEDCSEPLVFNHRENKPMVTSSELKTILDDDLIQKLFSDEEMKNLQLLVIITLGCGIISLLGIGYLVFGKSEVKDTPELRSLIYNVTRSAILGVPV